MNVWGNFRDGWEGECIVALHFQAKIKTFIFDHSVEKGVVVFLVIVIDILIIQADVTIKIVLNACLLLPFFLKL